ncbi:MAG TPA: hypothetical protein VL856_10855 [Acidimicrobiia bacterium]|jgi:hypothetical protein|nr:hypothetical protein [Acidimicrobiia bacterium]
MSDPKAKWDEVGDQFNALGRRMKEHYDEHAAPKDEVHDALRQIADALDNGFTALGDSLRDPSIRDDLKRAGNSIGDAIAATFETVASEIRKAVRK